MTDLRYEEYTQAYKAITQETGDRGRENGAELIAQSAASVYNRNDEHPIADAVERFLAERQGQ